VLRVAAAEVDLAEDVLWQAGALAVEERPAGDEVELVTAFPPFAHEAALLAVAARGWAVQDRTVDEAAYLDAWRAFATPVRVGERVVVEPAWQPSQARPGELAVRIDPGRAFGSGAHPSTRLVLDALVACVRRGDRVLDVGCGSGVLAVVAAMLGAEVTAVDVDPEAVRATAANASANGVRVEVTSAALADVPGSFAVVCANPLAPVLVELAPELRRLVHPGGVLLASGLLPGRWDHVAAALAPLAVVEVAELDGWAALVLSRPS
jgi:ribosomal protein L11 methyltransferase